MALWRSVGSGPGGRACDARFPVRLTRCPRCHSTDFEKEESVPKITRHGGPSHATSTAEEVASSPGISSQTSTSKPETKQQPNGAAARKPARTTANRSKKAQQASSTARTTAGGRTAGTSETTENA